MPSAIFCRQDIWRQQKLVELLMTLQSDSLRAAHIVISMQASIAMPKPST